MEQAESIICPLPHPSVKASSQKYLSFALGRGEKNTKPKQICVLHMRLNAEQVDKKMAAAATALPLLRDPSILVTWVQHAWMNLHPTGELGGRIPRAQVLDLAPISVHTEFNAATKKAFLDTVAQHLRNVGAANQGHWEHCCWTGPEHDFWGVEFQC